MVSAMLHDHSSYCNNLIRSSKKGNPSTELLTSSLTSPSLYLGTSGARALLFRGRDWNSRNRPDALFYGFSRQCSRMPFLLSGALRYGPYAYSGPIVFDERTRCAVRVAILLTRTLLYSRIKTPGPWPRAPRKFRSEIHYAIMLRPRGWTLLPRRSHLVDFFSAEFARFITMPSAHANVYPPLFIGLRPAMPHLCSCERTRCFKRRSESAENM